MHPLVLVPLAACVIAAMIAAAILSHDPGQRANRIVGTLLGCSAWWSLCEVLWNPQPDPQVAIWLVRLSAFGWMPLGPLAVALLGELAGERQARVRRWLPLGWTLTGISMALYILTPWGVSDMVRTSWGWSFRFGFLFPVAYALTVGQVVIAMAYWPKVLSGAAPTERRQGLWLLVGFAAPMTVASLTDVVLPLLDLHVPRLGSASILVVGCVAAWSVSRDGHFTLAPGAFTHEILETLTDGVVLLRPDGRVRTANEGFARLVGRSRDAVTGASLRRFLPELSAAPDTELTDREAELRRDDGSRIPVSVSSSPLVDTQGQTVGQVCAVHDLRDVTALRQRLLTSGRLAAVGELAAGIAHEINNPITYVRANLSTLRSHWLLLGDEMLKNEDSPEREALMAEGEEVIDECVEGVERVASIVREVGAFTHAGRGRTELANVNELIDNALSVAVLSFSVVIERCYGDLPPVVCDPQQLKQAFANLLLNAIEAVGDSGRIRMVTQSHGDWVVVRVEDDGPGIPPDEIDRIFDPFFTTRPTGEGVGLGLATSYQIVRNLGGEISVSSRPGKGATFRVRIPAARV